MTAARRWRAALTFPGVEPNVMMIPARGNESSGPAVILRQLEAEHTAVKCERTVQIGHFEMHMANPDFGMNGSGV